jgi:minor extracellular serine protease Vpr
MSQPLQICWQTSAAAGSVLPNTDVSDPLKVGAGLINLGKAMNPPALAFPASLSFGLVRPVGNQNYQMTFTLENPTDHPVSYSVISDENLSIIQKNVTVNAKEVTKITVNVVNRGDHLGGQQGTPDLISGYIHVNSENGNIRIPYLYVIDYNR